MAQPLDVREALPALLAEVPRPGEYVGSGVVDLPVVCIHVDGVGTLGLPVPPVQAEALVRVASPAPYGRGPDTLVDSSVRRCGQISAACVRADDARWARILDGIVAAAAAALGVDEKVSAALYKLLVYQPGDFFVEHRDTEKVPRMFATLVVVLPSPHSGGELVVRHSGRETTLDLATADLGQVRWAAFYADCQHELRTLRGGHRIALVYNLVRAKGRAPRVPDARPVISQVAAALRAWEARPDSPIKVVYPLKHQYSLAELAFSTLKNEDAAAASVLSVAARESGFVLRLAMLSIEESGSAEQVWERQSRGRRRGVVADDDSDAFEVIDVMDRSESLDAWRRPDDALDPLGPIPIDEDEVSPPDALADEEPDEVHFHEATGNEGCSFERTYRRACLVLWPLSRALAVLHQAGPEASLTVLERLLEDEPLRAHEMAELLVNGWARGESVDRGAGPLRARFIRNLARLPTPDPLRRFLWEVVGAGAFDGAEHEALVSVLPRFDDALAGDTVARLVAASARSRFAPVARLVRATAVARPGVPLQRAVGLLFEALPPNGGAASREGSAASPIPALGPALVDLVLAVDACRDSELSARLLQDLAANPERWHMDDAVVPAAVALSKADRPPKSPLRDGMRGAALRHLRARIAEPLDAPRDATRSDAGWACGCAICASFRVFLGHPVHRVWSLKADKFSRSHVEQQVRAAGCDVDMRTDSGGRPHTLICTKNQASYEARVKQRAADLETVAQLS